MEQLDEAQGGLTGHPQNAPLITPLSDGVGLSGHHSYMSPEEYHPRVGAHLAASAGGPAARQPIRTSRSAELSESVVPLRCSSSVPAPLLSLSLWKCTPSKLYLQGGHKLFVGQGHREIIAINSHAAAVSDA